jgi:hypothetical protein
LFSQEGQIEALTQKNIKEARERLSKAYSPIEIKQIDTVFKEIEVPAVKKKNPYQVHTVAGKNQHSGGYGAIIFKGSEFNEVPIFILAIRGAWVVNRSLGIGLEIDGLLPVSKYENIDPEGINSSFLVGGYGGFFLEPILWSNAVVHLTFPVTAGAGWMGYIEDWENNTYNYNGDLYDHDVFWYVEPGVNLEVNVARFFRIGLGVSKRFTQDLVLINTPSDAFDNLNYSVTLKFGGF